MRVNLPEGQSGATGIVACLASVLAISGCASIAERIGTNLVEQDLKTVEQEFEVFHADLALFRACLTDRGGSCEAGQSTPLPHSSQAGAGQATGPVVMGAGQALTQSVSALPDDHEARRAFTLLNHPVVRQAVGLHNHLRGYDSVAEPGFSAHRGTGANGEPQSRASLNLKVGHVHHFHHGLLASLGTTVWESLHDHCAGLLAAHGDGPGRGALEADCRRAAFIRGYFEAYTRTGEFVEVDVQLAGAIRAVTEAGDEIGRDIDGLLAKLARVRTGVSSFDTRALKEIGKDAGKVGNDVEALVESTGDRIAQRFGVASATIVGELSRLADAIGSRSEQLAQAAGRSIASDIAKLVSDLDELLDSIGAKLDELEKRVAAADQKVVDAINDEVGKADATLSNVFKLTSVGFVSRNQEFRARLPTLEVTFDPTVSHVLTITDVDTDQVLSASSDFKNLGVVTDTSGVGTGTRIGAELVRVFLEAIFDAHEGLPAIAPVNGARPTALSLGEYSLPLFTTPMGNIDSRDLSHMMKTNNEVAAKTRAIVSRIVDGFGPLNFNNPALEAFIVEIVATSVREATAKATWCWYACNLDVELKKLEADARTTAEDEAHAVEDRVKSKVKKAAENVRLHLHLTD